jgi:hypothetical protein
LVSSIVPATGTLSRMKSKKLLVKRRVDSVVRRSEPHRVAVGGRAQHRGHADVPAGANLVLDDELLAQALGQKLSDDARHGVVRSAGGERDDPVDRPSWIPLRPCDARNGWQRGGARCQM